MNWLRLGIVGCVFGATFSFAEEKEPLFADLPFGVFIEESAVIPADQTNVIGKKLGGVIESLSNSTLRVHGTPIRVNVIQAKTDADAEAIHKTVSGMKSNRVFCVRRGRSVVEYPGDRVDPATAVKTSYELRLVPKPKSVRYRIVADIALVEEADYMASNELFNLLISQEFEQGDAATLARIQSLKQGFQFGDSLVLRSSPAFRGSTHFAERPTPVGSGSVRFQFELEGTPSMEGIPYVTQRMETTVDDTGRWGNYLSIPKKLMAATRHWPADDPEIVSLANRITAGKQSEKEKVQAILEWLAPGKNLEYGGKTGSRWGVKKVLGQKFGHCWDFSDVFVTLARASGVQSRQVAGWLFGGSGHVWAEYVDGKTWQQVDPTGGGRLDCGIYHIPWFTTEDGEMPILYLSMPQIEVIDAN